MTAPCGSWWTIPALLFAAGCAGPRQYLPKGGDTWLVYERTPCFGPCPVFKLEVSTDGTARFHGGRNAEPNGHHLATWGNKERQIVAEKAHGVRFKSKAGQYDNPLITDLPAKRIQLAGNDLYDRFDGPNIDALYTALDSLISITTWIPSGH